jgi:mono/diheme cytochrome c family protein
LQDSHYRIGYSASGREDNIMRLLLRLAMCACLAPLPWAISISADTAQDPKPTIKRVPAQRTDSLDGQTLYSAYCAVCHGKEGKGDGPAAPALKTPPADLTTITKRYGQFPRTTIEAAILGEEKPVAAHGSREMPVWGPVFRKGGRDVATLSTANLIDYLRSIQAK